MKKFFDTVEFNWKDAIWWGTAIGMFVGRRFIGSVRTEWHTYYYQAISRGFQNMPGVANPPYTSLLLFPFALFPMNLGSEVFSFVNIIAVALGCKLIGGNRWAVLLSFPFGWLVWYGQIDGLVALGVGLGYWAIQRQKPYWVGVACLLLGIKPQIGGVLALYYLWHIKNIKALFFPLIAVSVSVILFGVWPIDYLQRLASSSDSTFFTQQPTNIGLFPWGIVSWVVFLFGPYRLRQRIILILCATMLSSPYVGHYSTLSLIIFSLPWWSYIFFSAPFVLPTSLDAIAVTLGVVLVATVPLTLRFWRNSRLGIGSHANLSDDANVGDSPG